MSVNALIITGFGINCDLETAAALDRAGAQARRVHLNDLIADQAMLTRARILAVPGGFSFGDDIASGRVLANRLRYKLGGALQSFVADGNLVIGICNGFQVLAKMGLLPGLSDGLVQEVTLTHNDSGRFENRWVTLQEDASSHCVWTRGIGQLELPIRHGEGKFIPRDDAMLRRLQEGGHVALRYVRPAGAPASREFPFNPNGSIDDIAGICDATGRVFGLMPHPEAYVDRNNHPRWTRETLPEEGAGLAVFRNAIRHAQSVPV